MKASHLFFVIALVVVLWFVSGCSEEPVPVERWPRTDYVASIWINMVDTLTFLPGDSAVVDGWITVRNESHLVMPGVVVEISADSCGIFELLDPAHGDTTNELGRVNFRFHSFDHDGTCILVACCEGICDTFSFVIVPAQDVVAHLTLSISPDTLWVTSGSEDSALVSMTALDSQNNGVPNLRVNVRATGGLLGTMPRTDSAGAAHAYWLSNHQYGTFFIFASAGMSVDSAVVMVMQRHCATLQIMFWDTLSYLPGDSAVADGWVTIRDQEHLVVPGVPVLLSLEQPRGWLAYLDPALGDTTNEFGRVNFGFRSYGNQGHNAIIACCETVCDTFAFVVQPAW